MTAIIGLYVMYGSSLNTWGELLFRRRAPEEFVSLYFTYVGFLEFYNILFVRTRLSLKYHGKFITIANIMFLFYMINMFEPFYYEAVWTLIYFSIFLMCAFLHFCEIPALHWNPFKHYTPSINNPRTGYIPVPMEKFLLNFDLWTVCYPMRFRENFSPEEQRLFDEESAVDDLYYDFRTSREMRRALIQPDVNLEVRGGENNL